MPAIKKPRKAARIGAEDARDKWGDYLDRVRFGGERFIITRHGKDSAALVSLEDLQKLEGAA